MPPRKRLKGATGAAVIVSGPNTPAVINNFEAVSKLQKDTLSIVNSIYELRHSSSKNVQLEPQGLLVPSDAGMFAWPVCHGGTFKDIAQRAWQQPEKLLQMSATLAHGCGLLDSPDEAELTQQFCKVDVPWGLEVIIQLNLFQFVLKRCSGGNRFRKIFWKYRQVLP